MKKVIQLYSLILIILLGFATARSEEALTLEAKIDTNNLLIGDQFRYRVSATFGKGVNFVFPKFKDKIGDLEIVSTNKIDTIKSDKYTAFMQSYVLTAFDSGHYVIPALEIIYDKKGFSDPYIARTDSITVSYKTLTVDTTQAFKDIKPPLGIEFSIWDYWYWFVIIVVLAIAGYFGYNYWKNRIPKAIVFESSDPKIPPHILALEALKKLENEKLWQNGQVKKYYIELTNIIRLYIERTTKVAALEMTSDEIYIAMSNVRFGEEQVSKLKYIFQLGDLAKFAKQEPLAQENATALQSAVLFIQEAHTIFQAGELEQQRRNIQATRD